MNAPATDRDWYEAQYKAKMYAEKEKAGEVIQAIHHAA